MQLFEWNLIWVNPFYQEEMENQTSKIFQFGPSFRIELEISLKNHSRSVFWAHLREIQTSFLVAEKKKDVSLNWRSVVPHRHLKISPLQKK